MNHLRLILRAPRRGLCGNATAFARRRHGFAKSVTLLLAPLLLLPAGQVCAAELKVGIVDRQGHGVAEAVVLAAPLGAQRAAVRGAPSAVMDQLNRAFVPGLLVVAVGTKVEFPNNDTVSHQVYSFSPAKRFQLPLYKGKIHQPVTFDQAGLVVLGCNIHDQMLGYIYVTDAPHFGKTDADGAWRSDELPPGDYRLTVWSPFIADAPALLSRQVHVDAAGPTAVRFELTQELRLRPEPRPRHSDWEY